MVTVTPKTEKQIHDLRKKKTPLRQIASKLGVSRYVVNMVLQGGTIHSFSTERQKQRRCKNCKTLIFNKAKYCSDCNESNGSIYLPRPEEITAMTKEIQSKWSSYEKRQRADPRSIPQPVDIEANTVPAIPQRKVSTIGSNG